MPNWGNSDDAEYDALLSWAQEVKAERNELRAVAEQMAAVLLRWPDEDRESEAAATASAVLAEFEKVKTRWRPREPRRSQ